MFTAHDPTGEPFAFADSSKAARAACEDRGRGCYVARDGVVLSWDPRRVIPKIDAEYVPRTRVLTTLELWALCLWLSPNKAARIAWMVATCARWAESVRAEAGDTRAGGVRWFMRGTKTKRSRGEVNVPGPFRILLEWSLERANREGRLFDSWTSAGNELRRVRRARHPTCVLQRPAPDPRDVAVRAWRRPAHHRSAAPSRDVDAGRTGLRATAYRGGRSAAREAARHWVTNGRRSTRIGGAWRERRRSDRGQFGWKRSVCGGPRQT